MQEEWDVEDQMEMPTETETTDLDETKDWSEESESGEIEGGEGGIEGRTRAKPSHANESPSDALERGTRSFQAGPFNAQSGISFARTTVNTGMNVMYLLSLMEESQESESTEAEENIKDRLVKTVDRLEAAGERADKLAVTPPPVNDVQEEEEKDPLTASVDQLATGVNHLSEGLGEKKEERFQINREGTVEEQLSEIEAALTEIEKKLDDLEKSQSLGEETANHLFQFLESEGEDEYVTEAHSTISKKYSPEENKTEISAVYVDGTVAFEAESSNQKDWTVKTDQFSDEFKESINENLKKTVEEKKAGKEKKQEKSEKPESKDIESEA